MYGWRKVFVIGVDLTGRRCRVAQVSVPAQYDRERALQYVRALKSTGPNGEYLPYATADIEWIEW